MKKIKYLLFLLFAIQLLVPLSMIIRKEMILRGGTIVKFQVQPVDPYDPFRGKYLSIGVIGATVHTRTENFNEDQKVYALLTVDSEGFAEFIDVSDVPYSRGLYMQCTVESVENDHLILNPPFDRYYLNEKYSKPGEKLYNEYSNGNREDAYVTVRIKKGHAVLENMYLADMEIYRFIEDNM